MTWGRWDSSLFFLKPEFSVQSVHWLTSYTFKTMHLISLVPVCNHRLQGGLLLAKWLTFNFLVVWDTSIHAPPGLSGLPSVISWSPAPQFVTIPTSWIVHITWNLRMFVLADNINDTRKGKKNLNLSKNFLA